MCIGEEAADLQGGAAEGVRGVQLPRAGGHHRVRRGAGLHRPHSIEEEFIFQYTNQIKILDVNLVQHMFVHTMMSVDTLILKV